MRTAGPYSSRPRPISDVPPCRSAPVHRRSRCIRGLGCRRRGRNHRSCGSSRRHFRSRRRHGPGSVALARRSSRRRRPVAGVSPTPTARDRAVSARGCEPGRARQGALADPGRRDLSDEGHLPLRQVRLDLRRSGHVPVRRRGRARGVRLPGTKTTGWLTRGVLWRRRAPGGVVAGLRARRAVPGIVGCRAPPRKARPMLRLERHKLLRHTARDRLRKGDVIIRRWERVS